MDVASKPFASRRSVGSYCRPWLYETRGPDDLERSICHARHLNPRVLRVHYGHVARRILSLESRFYRYWSMEVASRRFLGSSKMNSGRAVLTIGSWS